MGWTSAVGEGKRQWDLPLAGARWLCATAEAGTVVPAEHPEPARSLRVLSAVVGAARAAGELYQRDEPSVTMPPNPPSLEDLMCRTR